VQSYDISKAKNVLVRPVKALFVTEHTIGNLLITVKHCVHCEIWASLKKELSIQYNISQPDGSIPRDEIYAWADVKVKYVQQQGPCIGV
jgi:hypothetical protein